MELKEEKIISIHTNQPERINPAQLLDVLKSQKDLYHSQSSEKRKYVIREKISEIRQLKQSESDGTYHHPGPFKKANREIDLFEAVFPQLKFPQDTVLNTYDNTKRWLKELDIPEKKKYWKEFRSNDFKHYKGKPWNYAPGVPDKFEEFKAYHFIEQEESGEDKCRRLKVEQHRYVKPVGKTLKEFSFPIFDRTHIYVPENPIHNVKYLPQPSYQNDQRLSTGISKQSNCKLNQIQRVKAFTSCSTRSEMFQRKYTPLNCEKRMNDGQE